MEVDWIADREPPCVAWPVNIPSGLNRIMICRCCSRAHVPITPPIHKSIHVSSRGLKRFANTRLRTSNGHRGPEPTSTICTGIRRGLAQSCPFRVPHVPVFRILRQHGCILDRPDRHHRPQDRPLPMEEIQLDFNDATSVPPDPEGKQQHVVEICNFVDAGTSTWLMAEARSDFHAETALEGVIGFLTRYGRPRCMTFDRDSRWVGSHSLRHFPSAFCRFLLCLGIQPNVCPKLCPD